MKKSLIFILGLSATVILTGCQKPPVPEVKIPTGTVKIVTTFYPLYDFASKIVGSLASVENMTPIGMEPHNFEPSPKDMEVLYGASEVILNGAGMDLWAENSTKDLIQKGIKVIKLSDAVPLMAEAKQNNPHFWLDPILAQQEVLAIRDSLIQLMPEKRSLIEKKTATLILELKKLDTDYKKDLKYCTFRQAVVSHNAFGYLGKRYGIDFLPISGLSPDEEPSARTLADLASLMKAKGLKTVFFETLATPKLAETLSKEVGANILILNPLEGLTAEETKTGKDYFSIMRENLKNLKTALQCR